MDNNIKNKEQQEKEVNNKNIQYKKINNFYKIRRGPNYNAYQRKNLGSIPSKFDNFIFKLPEESKSNLTSTLHPKMFRDENLCFRKDIFKIDHKFWKNFGSGNSIELKGNSLKFSVNNNIKSLKKNKSEYDLSNIESFKTIYTNTNKSTAQSAINKDNKDIDKDILEKGNIFEKLKSDNEYSLYLNEYKKNKRKIIHNKFNKEDRYNNIYYKREIQNKYYPGPGDYDIGENSMITQKSPFRYYSLFKYKSNFPLLELQKSMSNIGPGSYNCLRKNKIPGGTFSTLKRDNINNPFYNNEEYINNVGPGSNNLPGSFNIKEKDKMNYFFIKSPDKKENLEKKYGIERVERFSKTKSTGKFDEFNGKPRWSDKEKTKDFNNDWINRNLQKKILEEQKKGNIVDINGNLSYEEIEQNVKKDRAYWARMVVDGFKKGREIAIKRKGAYSFSKIPKLIRENNHVPGPSYYEPERILNGIKLKKEFNSNSEMNWI